MVIGAIGSGTEWDDPFVDGDLLEDFLQSLYHPPMPATVARCSSCLTAPVVYDSENRAHLCAICAHARKRRMRGARRASDECYEEEAA